LAAQAAALAHDVVSHVSFPSLLQSLHADSATA